MRAVIFLILLAAAVPANARPETLGIFARWGAFQDREAGTCYASAEPVNGAGEQDWRPFASIGSWPGRAVRAQLHIRLSRNKRAGSAVILRIDDRNFQLRAGGANAWAPDARADAAIVAAMRTGLNMSVETRSQRGGRIRDNYQLRGAASAIDAAAVACANAGKKPR